MKDELKNNPFIKESRECYIREEVDICCEKCGKEQENRCTHIREREIFRLCSECDKHVELLVEEHIQAFWQPLLSKRTDPDWVNTNIREAKERREKGINLWK